MHKPTYFILGAAVMLLVLFLFGKLKTKDTPVGRYQIAAFAADVNEVWVVDTKTGVVKQFNYDGTQRGKTIEFVKKERE